MNPHFNHKHHRRNEIKFPTTPSSELPPLKLVKTLSTEYNNPIQQRATNTFGGVSTYENLHYNTQPNDDVVTTAATAVNNARHNKNTNFQPHYDEDLLRRQRHRCRLYGLISSSQSVSQAVAEEMQFSNSNKRVLLLWAAKRPIDGGRNGKKVVG